MERDWRRIKGLGVGLFLVLAVGYGWLNRGQPLAFATLERGDFSGWNAREPGLMVVTNAEEARTLIGWVPDEVQARVAVVDFERYGVVATFQGSLPDLRDGEGITVRRVIGRAGDIFLEAWRPSLSDEAAPAHSSPYHLIRIEKARLEPGRVVRFTLSLNGWVVQPVTQVVP